MRKVRVRVRNLAIATLLLLVASVSGFGQTQTVRQADCTFGFNFTGVASSIDFDNRQSACTTWVMVYNNTGFSALSIELDGAPDNGGQPGTYVSWPNVALGTTLPLTNIVNGIVTGYKYQPWVKVKVNSVTGTGSIRGTAIGFRPLSGQDAASVYQAFSAGIPLQGQGGGAVDGDSNTVAYPLDNTANARSLLVSPRIFNGTTWDRVRSESSATQTGSLIPGINLVQQGASIAVNSQTAGGVQAVATVAAGAAGVKHVIDQVCFSAGSTVAPVLTQLSLNIRDGATGAGTIKASFILVIPAGTGQNTLPFCTAHLGIVGTAATAATAEWSAGLANLLEQVTLLYHDIQ